MKKFVPYSCEIKDLDNKGTVTFYGNAFDVKDSDGDISLKGSFKKTLQENRSRLRHLKWHDPRYMIGAIKEINEDEIGLNVVSKLMMNTQLGKETYEEYKALMDVGQRHEHSVAVMPIKYEHTDDGREVSEWRLHEVSTVAWGANSMSLVTDIKNLKDYSREDIEKDIVMLRALINIKSYDDLKLAELDKQINYLEELKAALQPDLEKDTTDLSTLNEFKNILNIK